MNVLAIDPGPTYSAYVLLGGAGRKLLAFGKVTNWELHHFIQIHVNNESLFDIDEVVIEMIASYGMPVGAEVFETCVEIGMLTHICQGYGVNVSRLFRKEVCHHLCGSAKAKDSNIRQRCLDMYPATGGGKTPQVGIKKNKGPLFGVSKDVWAALAVGLTYLGAE